MRFELQRDPARFERQAGSLLEPGAGTVWAAFRTPPYRILAAPGLPAERSADLVERWLAVVPEAPGVNSVPDVARPLSAALVERTGRPARLLMSMAMHVLEEVRDPPRPAPGQVRVAGVEDRPRLADWWRGFQQETGVPEAGLTGLDSRLERGGVWLWVHGGEPVSLVAHAQAVAGVVRIGPVYTPPSLRGRGYASSAVAAVSREALASGAQRCMLYTDLANPISNKIYAEVGYRRVADWEEHELA